MTALRLTFSSVALLAIGCGPSSESGDSEASSSSDTSVTSTSTSVGTSVTSDDTSDDTSTATTDPSTTVTTDPSTSSSTTAGDCMPGNPPACPLDECLQQWSFSCDCVDDFADRDVCFEIDIECAWPRLDCGLPSPCPRVWGIGFDMFESFEDEQAAICLLQSLRDGVPGSYDLLFGMMGDTGLVEIELLTDGGGTVLMQYDDTCQGCPNSGFFGRSGALELQPTAFFDNCLAAPTTQSLVDCLFGFTTFQEGAPPALDWTPPFTTRSCVNLDWACPAP